VVNASGSCWSTIRIVSGTHLVRAIRCSDALTRDARVGALCARLAADPHSGYTIDTRSATSCSRPTTTSKDAGFIGADSLALSCGAAHLTRHDGLRRAIPDDPSSPTFTASPAISDTAHRSDRAGTHRTRQLSLMARGVAFSLSTPRGARVTCQIAPMTSSLARRAHRHRTGDRRLATRASR